MAFQLSPGVNVSEIDLTTVVPAVATSDGAIGGVFRWGPVGQRLLIDNENILAARYGKPTSFNAETWFTAANFLSYTNRLYVSRAANTTGTSYVVANNRFTANTTVANNIISCDNTAGLVQGMYITQSANSRVFPAGSENYITSVNSTCFVLSKSLYNSAQTAGNITETGNVQLYFGSTNTSYSALALMSESSFVIDLAGQIVKNDNEYESKDGTFDTDVAYVAKYPGELGNSLKISVCDTEDSYSSVITLTGNDALFAIGSSTITVKTAGSGNNIASDISVGDQILTGNSDIGFQYMKVKSVSGAVDATVNTSSLSFYGNTQYINNVSGFITMASGVNPYNNGDIVRYTNAASNAAIAGIASCGINGSNNFLVFGAEETGFYITNTAGGSAIVGQIPEEADVANFTLKGNTGILTVNFEDPFRLRSNFSTHNLTRHWEYFNLVDTAPMQSNYQYNNGNTSAMDELHIVIVDEGGGFTGTPGTVLEVYKGLSRATDAMNDDGSVNYYKNVINKNSNYVWWANDRTEAVSNGAIHLTNSSALAPMNIRFKLGSDGKDENNVNLSTVGAAYDLFQSAEDVDVSLILQGKPIGGSTVVNGQTVENFQLANYIIDNICEIRKDCVAFITPDKAMMLNNVGNEALSLKNWRGSLRSTSYAVLDSSYKYQYDRYNDVYRWLPMNGDIGGLCARTDQTNDAWWSPAGYNRGNIKNIVKLAYNPKKADRDVLYSNGVNPIISSPGLGTVLYGDKTLLSKPSAFDRINVRRLFIVLEKAISTAAKYSLFEFNDQFTRAQFKNLVTPYLRTIKGRRGITDFLVVCDDTNNTPQIIDTNQFVGDIYIKPARSINFIQLNFVAVPTGVQFSEVVGKF